MTQHELQAQLISQAAAAKTASRIMKKMTTDKKNEALESITASLEAHVGDILAENKKDLAAVEGSSPSDAFLSRLSLDEEKIRGIVSGIRAVVELDDPVGEITQMKRRPNGLRIGKIRIPIGVLCCIYESRPNVTVDIAVLAIKSGNACVLRGGKEAIHTNNIFATLIREAIDRAGVPSDAVQFVSEIDRAGVPMLAELDQYIDLIIPRGGEGLVDAVTARAKMPVLRHRKGVTHMYIDREANIDHALKIVLNGKTSNPSVCNSLEKVLVDAAIAESVVPRLVEQLKSAHVEVRGCERTAALADVVPAEVEDWSTEYLDLIIAMKIVDDIDDAIDHIQTFSTGRADGSVTENYSHAWKFLTAVDSGATYVNASTRFTDGGEFGLGAEVGISTAKIHGMGPMGLEELTVTKYIVFGDGQIRE